MIVCKNCQHVNPDDNASCSKCFMPMRESKVVDQPQQVVQEKKNTPPQSGGGSVGIYSLVLSNGTERSLHPGDNLIGRKGNVDIAVPNDSFMSRQHATLTVNNDGCYLKDTHSSNGTTIGNKAIPTTPIKIKEETTFTCGRTTFTLRCKG